MLSINDLIVFPYQQSNESSSASVRQGIATLKPVLVTPSSIFNDVNDLVDYCEGFTAVDIANGIEDFFKKNNFKHNISQKKDILERRKFSVVAKRLISMIKSLEIN